MRKNRLLSPLLLTAALMWSCTSGAMSLKKNEKFSNEIAKKMEKNEKNKKNSPINAFISAQEARAAYKRLWKKERVLIQLTDDLAEEEKQKYEEQWELYRLELTYFYQRLFRFIVAKDIKEKVPYTIILGLKVQNDGTLTMERLPVPFEKINEQNSHLFALSIYPNNKERLDLIKEYHKSNPASDKSADELFPRMIITAELNEKGEKLDGEYDEKNNTINIPKDKFLLLHCTSILHEFAHARQRCQAGGKAHLLNKCFSKLPFCIALELDAEYESIRHHPNQKHLLSLSKEGFKQELKKLGASAEAKKRFPYCTYAEKYFITCTLYKHGNEDLYAKAKEIHQKLVEAMPTIIKSCNCQNQIGPQTAYPDCYLLMKDTYTFKKNFTLRTERVKEELIKAEKSGKKIEAIKKTNNFILGCENFFNLTCKALGIGQNDEKLENKIEKI